MTTAASPRTAAGSVTPGLFSSWRYFRHTMGNALIVTRREVLDSFRDWRIIAPIIILTFLFPALSQFGATMMINFVTEYGAELIGERTIPFLLMIVGFFPISLSLVIALETFVGEKERRSLEPLLSSPLTNLELYIGKTLAAMIPPLVASYLGMMVYMVSLLFGDLAWRPQPVLIVQIVLLTTAQALLMVTGAVVVSSQTTSTRAANLLASFIIVPMSLMIILESIVMFGAPDAESPNGIFALWVILVGLLLGTALFMRIGTRIFRREELLGSSLDMLNLRWIGRTLWRSLRGSTDLGLAGWYRAEVWSALRKLGAPTAAVALCMAAALIGGYVIGQVSDWQIPAGSLVEIETMNQNFRMWYELGSNPGTVVMAVWQNGRVLLAATLLAMVSFGVMAVVLAILPFGILGWIFSQFALLGIDPSLFFAAVVPHSLVEVPAILIATAAAFRLGAIITQKPPQGQTVGQTWLGAAADAMKVGVAVVLPLLILAALVEVFITPEVVQVVIGG